MEFVLQAVVVVFMLFLCALCLFAVVVIARDIIHESAANKRAREAENNSNLKEPVQVVVQPVVSAPVASTQPAAPVAEPAPAPAPVAEPAPAPVEKEEVAVAPVAEAVVEEVAVTEDEEDPDAVSFSRVSLTMEEKYDMLSTEFKRYFDEIVKNTAKYAFDKLENEYGVECKVVKM